MGKLKLFYAGKRLVNDKLIQVFVDEKGEDCSFQGTINGVFIGSAYEATQKGESVSIAKRPNEIKLDDDFRHPKEQEWRTETWAAEAQYKQLSIKRLADKKPELLKEIGAIKAFVKGLKYSERHAFVNWIMDEIQREEMEKLNQSFRIKLEAVEKRLINDCKRLQKELKKAQKVKANAKP